METENTEQSVANKSESIEAEPKPASVLQEEAKNNEPQGPENTGTVAGGSGAKPKQSPVKTATRKRKRQKAPKDVNAPKHPLTGYVRYMNEIRESVRQKHPNLAPIEVTKILAEEWSKLPDEKKKPYLEAAEADKERYNKEISEYKLSNETAKAKAKPIEPIQSTKESIPLAKIPAFSVPYVNGKAEQKVIRRGDYDISIFTEDFLDHNKLIDSQLRTLRKSNIDYEQQNSVLEKHVENMENGIQKMESETSILNARNAVLEKYLLKLRTTLANSLQALPVGSGCPGATVENIDQYLADLHQMADSSTQGHTLNKAKDIIRKLDLQNLTP